MKLTAKQQDILSHLHFQTAEPISRVAKDSGYSERAVNYTLKILSDRNAIVPWHVIDTSALGFSKFGVFFQLGSTDQKNRKRLLKYLINSEGVSWLCEFSGNYHYGFELEARTIKEVWDTLNDLTDQFGNIFRKKVVNHTLSISTFAQHDSQGKLPRRSQIDYFEESMNLEIDQLDHEILSVLSTQALTSNSAISRAVGAPSSTIKYRMDRFRDNKVVRGHCYYVRPEAFGASSYLLLLKFDSVDYSCKKEVTRVAHEHRNIEWILHCIGPWDFEVAAWAWSSSEIVRIVQELYEKIGNSLVDVQILPTLGVHKLSPYPWQALPMQEAR